MLGCGVCRGLMNRDVDNPVRGIRNVVRGGHLLPALAGPPRLDAVSRCVAAVDKGVADGIGAAVGQLHVVIGAADGIGPAHDRRDRVGIALQQGGQIGDDFLPVGASQLVASNPPPTQPGPSVGTPGAGTEQQNGADGGTLAPGGCAS